jgi:hypothetical protein
MIEENRKKGRGLLVDYARVSTFDQNPLLIDSFKKQEG